MQEEYVASGLQSVEFDCKTHVSEPFLNEGVPLVRVHAPSVETLKYTECRAHWTADEKLRFLFFHMPQTLVPLRLLVKVLGFAIFIIDLNVISKSRR